MEGGLGPRGYSSSDKLQCSKFEHWYLVEFVCNSMWVESKRDRSIEQRRGKEYRSKFLFSLSLLLRSESFPTRVLLQPKPEAFLDDWHTILRTTKWEGLCEIRRTIVYRLISFFHLCPLPLYNYTRSTVDGTGAKRIPSEQMDRTSQNHQNRPTHYKTIFDNKTSKTSKMDVQN